MSRAPRYRKVFVVSPTGLVTGGPESLHSLVHAIRQRGGAAFVSYHPFGNNPPVPEPYRHFDLACADPEDAPGHLIVIPESATGLVWQFQRAAKAIWWLSYDNFFGPRPQSDDAFRRLVATYEQRSRARLDTGRPRWDEIADVINFSQSAYATAELARRGIVTKPLPVPLNSAFSDVAMGRSRRDVIAFNPLKGPEYIDRLRTRWPSLSWLPLTGMDRAAVIETLSTVKLYVDFGFHPGRDRIPQEAAMCGACVITGRRGSAAHHADVPLPWLYRFDERWPWFSLQFGLVAKSVLSDHAGHARRFDDYRRFITATHGEFAKAVDTNFFEP